MAIAVLSTPASMTAEQYHRISEHAGCLPNRPAARTPISRLLRDTAIS